MNISIGPYQIWIGELNPQELNSLAEFLCRDDIAAGFVPDLASRPMSIHDRVHSAGVVWIAATMGGKIVGCRGVLTNLCDSENTFTTLAVDPALRGLGLGTELFDLSLRKAIALGHRTLRFDAPAGNDGVAALASRFGFTLLQVAPSEKRPAGVLNAIYVRHL